jgi:hypothetical protein
MISPNLHAIWVFLILESFSGFKARSFKIFWDLGRWLIIAGQSQKAFAAQRKYKKTLEIQIFYSQ